MFVGSFLVLLLSTLCVALNHWVLKDNGMITQKLDSPFYLRDPGNLIAFLEQIKYNDYVERSYLKLLRQREQIVEHLRFSVKYGEDLVEQAKCAVGLMEKQLLYFQVTPEYIKRFRIPEITEMSGQLLSGEPSCHQITNLAAGPCCFDHLESFKPEVMKAARMEREDEMNIGDLGMATDVVRRLALEGLTLHPRSWKFNTLSSYYWRLRGQPYQALECARLGVMFAPRIYKDIPLLSLGTILFRMGRVADADVVLSAAVEHAPDISENHVALATTLAMKHDFNRSLYHFDEAERIDPSLLPRTQPVRNFIVCLDNLSKKTAKMYSFVEYMKNEVKEFKKLKYQISQSHEKLMQQQVPLSARYANTKTKNEELLKRGQYCSTRTLSKSEGPVLFCDFYSDMQMRLESKDVDIDSLERDLRLTSEGVVRQISTEFRLNFEQIKLTKAQAPMPVGKVGTTYPGKDI